LDSAVGDYSIAAGESAPFVLKGHNVRTTAQRGWDTLGNGELLAAAERAGLDLFVTTDKNILPADGQQWPQLRPHVHRVVDAINAAGAGSYAGVDVP
jgi:hypothetical protein